MKIAKASLLLNLNKSGYMQKTTQNSTALLAATFTLITLYAVSAAPTPLLNLYQQQIGLTNGDLAMTAVSYFLSMLGTLLVLSRLSNHLGRRLISTAALGFIITACVLLNVAQDKTLFMLARAFTGVACGLGSSAVAAYIIDSVPPERAKLGTIITGSAPLVGLCGGTFSAAAWAAHSHDFAPIYITLILFSGIGLIGIGLSKETVPMNAKNVWRSLRPTLSVPVALRPYLPAAAAAFAGTWTMGGLYMAYSSSIVHELFGTACPLLAAAIYAALLAPNILGNMFAGKFNPQTAQKIGISLFFASVGCVAIALNIASATLFFAATLTAGIATGLAFTGSMQTLLQRTQSEDRAAVLSVIYLISYSGAVLPNFAVRQVADLFSLNQIVWGYVVLAFVAWLVVMIFSPRAKTHRVTLAEMIPLQTELKE